MARKTARTQARKTARAKAGAALSLRNLTKAPLRVIAGFGGSELAARLRLREPAARALYHGAKLGAQAIAAGAALAAGAKRASAASSGGGDPARLAHAPRGGLFDLTPTEDQAMMRATIRRFAEEVVRPAARAADDAARAQDEVLAQAHALGLAPLSIPTSLGGAATERSAVTNALVAEELARGDMGLALAILAPIAAVNAIVDGGTAEQQARLLPRFLEERFVPAALALLEPRAGFDPMRPRTGAVRARDGGWTLHGEKALVPLAESAELLLVTADVRGAGPALFVVERGTPGVRVEAEPAMGVRGAALGRVRFDGARLPADALLGGEPVRAFDLGALVDHARIAWCAMAVGAAQAVVDYVIPYCNARQAFGEPISNRQAVAFLVADAAIEVEAMRLLTWRAAALADGGGEVARAAALARAQCAAKGMKIGSDGVQLLGGHGFVKEHPVERWYRDLRAVGVFEGALFA